MQFSTFLNNQSIVLTKSKQAERSTSCIVSFVTLRFRAAQEKEDGYCYSMRCNENSVYALQNLFYATQYWQSRNI